MLCTLQVQYMPFITEMGSGNVDEMLGEWDPMAEDYLSIRNSYHINTDDPGIASVGYSKLNSYNINTDDPGIASGWLMGDNSCV